MGASDKAEFVGRHNYLRGQEAKISMATDMNCLQWDDELASRADDWAKTCTLGHPSGITDGQNVYATSGFKTYSKAIDNWFLERKYWFYGDGIYKSINCMPGKQCGHYTQIVWAKTTKVGCSSYDCDMITANGQNLWAGTVVVCNYQKPGNWLNEIMFTKGAAVGNDCPGNFDASSGLCCTAPVVTTEAPTTQPPTTPAPTTEASTPPPPVPTGPGTPLAMGAAQQAEILGRHNELRSGEALEHKATDMNCLVSIHFSLRESSRALCLSLAVFVWSGVRTTGWLKTWDEGLAGRAAAWASKCVTYHPSPEVQGLDGQNIFASTKFTTLSAAPDKWYSEKPYINFGDGIYKYTQQCQAGKVCGHYTQMVWGETTRVGCAAYQCDMVGNLWPGVVIVCNYQKRGNYMGQQIYTRGTETGSDCPGNVDNATGLCCGESPVTAPPPTTPAPAPTGAPNGNGNKMTIGAAEKAELVGRHNYLRGAEAKISIATDMNCLRWDDELASRADDWAKTCTLGHPSGITDGQNVYATSGFKTYSKAIDNWFLERKYWFYGDGIYKSINCMPGKQCGHYTQIVWAKTTKVGCASYNCGMITSNGQNLWPGTVVVCNYQKPGNWLNEIMFTKGAAVGSDCPGNLDASTGLCCSAEEDTTTQVPTTLAPTTEAPTEPSTEAPTEPPTEAPTEPPTEVPIEPPTEAPTEPPTAVPIEPPTEAPTEPPTEAPTEPPTEAPTEPPTEAPTEPPTELPIEPPTEAPTEPPTEAPTEPSTEAPTEPPTEAPTEPPTEAPTEPSTEAPTEPSTEAATEPPTEAPTEPPTEAPTEPSTEAPTEPPTEAPTEPPNEAPTTTTESPAMTMKAVADPITSLAPTEPPTTKALTMTTASPPAECQDAKQCGQMNLARFCPPKEGRYRVSYGTALALKYCRKSCDVCDQPPVITFRFKVSTGK